MNFPGKIMRYRTVNTNAGSQNTRRHPPVRRRLFFPCRFRYSGGNRMTGLIRRIKNNVVNFFRTNVFRCSRQKSGNSFMDSVFEGVVTDAQYFTVKKTAGRKSGAGQFHHIVFSGIGFSAETGRIGVRTRKRFKYSITFFLPVDCITGGRQPEENVFLMCSLKIETLEFTEIG